MQRLIIICVTAVLIAGIFGWMFRWEYQYSISGYPTSRIHRITGEIQTACGKGWY